MKKTKARKVSEVFPLTLYSVGRHYYRECDVESDKVQYARRALGNCFGCGYLLLDMLSLDLPLGSAIRVTFEVVPADENRNLCNLEERDKLTDTPHSNCSHLPTDPDVCEGGTGDPSK